MTWAGFGLINAETPSSGAMAMGRVAMPKTAGTASDVAVTTRTGLPGDKPANPPRVTETICEVPADTNTEDEPSVVMPANIPVTVRS